MTISTRKFVFAKFTRSTGEHIHSHFHSLEWYYIGLCGAKHCQAIEHQMVLNAHTHTKQPKMNETKCTCFYSMSLNMIFACKMSDEHDYDDASYTHTRRRKLLCFTQSMATTFCANPNIWMAVTERSKICDLIEFNAHAFSFLFIIKTCRNVSWFFVSRFVCDVEVQTKWDLL